LSVTVVFFDGVCNLCNGTVDFLIRADKQGKLRFASLQGKAAHELLGPEADEMAATIVVSDGEIYRGADAYIVIGARLGGIYGFAAALMALLPAFLRNGVYRFIAARRYKWFGKRDTCRVPTALERGRFLD
jgi:predicted DCC family thiol-disulfide oxidoreductase YuxK